MDPLDLLIGVAFAACVGIVLAAGFSGLAIAGVTVLLALGDVAGPRR